MKPFYTTRFYNALIPRGREVRMAYSIWGEIKEAIQGGSFLIRSQRAKTLCAYRKIH